MEMLEEIISIISSIFTAPALFLGLIAALGLVLAKEKTERVLTGAVKTALGLVILLSGSGMMATNLTPLMQVASHLLHVPPVDIPLGTNTVIMELGITVGLTMLFAFIINIILARITPLKYIYLTGHLMFWNAVIFGAVFKYVGGLSGWQLIAANSIFCGVFQTIQPWYTHWFDDVVCEKAGLTLGHSASLAVLVSSLINSRFGARMKRPKEARDMESLPFPESLAFLREPTLIMAFSYLVIYLVLTVVDYSYMVTLAGAMNPFLFSILQALGFTAGFVILMTGVRMLIAEIIPAFKGLATKLAPGALLAFDCTVFFPYGPVSVSWGGLIGVISMVIMSIAFATLGYPYFIFAPTMSVWFHGATAGLYGDKLSGITGAIIGGVTAGVLMASGQAAFWPIMGFAIGDFFSWASDTDYVWWGAILAYALLLVT